MTQTEIEALAQRMGDVGAGVPLQDLLAALGMVVTRAMMQLEPQERMAGTVGWIAVLTREMTRNWSRSRAN